MRERTPTLILTSYRNGERIIYESFDLSEKIFEKVRPHLKDIEQTTYINTQKAVQKWRMVRLNERLRFLRYPKGGFFRGHCDGIYLDQYLHIPHLSSQHSKLEQGNQTKDLLHAAILSPIRCFGSFVPAQGGSTRFLTRALGTKYADVEAVPGRVLVFQHAGLFHTGEEVIDGVKCAMRSDILYERVGPPVLSEKHEF
ncbi:oxidoreductase [Mycena olivaceomarginata]|nr:oxidoreductase [Mycena olivaceomarginata]